MIAEPSPGTSSPRDRFINFTVPVSHLLFTNPRAALHVFRDTNPRTETFHFQGRRFDMNCEDFREIQFI